MVGLHHNIMSAQTGQFDSRTLTGGTLRRTGAAVALFLKDMIYRSATGKKPKNVR